MLYEYVVHKQYCTVSHSTTHMNISPSYHTKVICFTKVRVTYLTLVMYLKQVYLGKDQICAKRTSPGIIREIAC